MEIFEKIYFNFFSIGALIPTVFHLVITIFLFSIPNKSRATLHLGIALSNKINRLVFFGKLNDNLENLPVSFIVKITWC